MKSELLCHCVDLTAEVQGHWYVVELGHGCMGADHQDIHDRIQW